MDRTILEQGISRYGTPSYIFDIDMLRDHVHTFRQILGDRAGLCYAIKANPFLTEQMAELADRLEVCSMGEYRICRRLGIPPEKLFISGVLKRKEEIYEVLEDTRGRSACTVESVQQFQYLVDWSEDNHVPVPVYIRLSSGNQFGVDWQTLLNLLAIRKNCPFVKIKGLHYFSGTQKRVSKIQDEIRELDRRCMELEELYGFPMETLEYGPGLSVSYFEGEPEQTLEDLKATVDAVGKMKWKGNVILEMGRALAAFCGYYLTQICEIKHTDGKHYCMTDGGIHQMHYDGQIRGMYRPCFQMIPDSSDGSEEEWTVFGALCTVNDILLQKVRVRGAAIGTTLVFERTGAYSVSEGIALFLSRELPAVALYSREKGWKQARARQSTYQWNTDEEENYGDIEEYFKRD